MWLTLFSYQISRGRELDSWPKVIFSFSSGKGFVNPLFLDTKFWDLKETIKEIVSKFV